MENLNEKEAKELISDRFPLDVEPIYNYFLSSFAFIYEDDHQENIIRLLSLLIKCKKDPKFLDYILRRHYSSSFDMSGTMVVDADAIYNKQIIYNEIIQNYNPKKWKDYKSTIIKNQN